MIKKVDKCLYCGEKMKSVTAKKRFCSDLHRVYWNRMRIAADKLGKAVNIQDLTNQTNQVKPFEQPKTNYVINTEIPPMPKREDFESSVEFGFAKSEWKKKYNQ